MGDFIKIQGFIGVYPDETKDSHSQGVRKISHGNWLDMIRCSHWAMRFGFVVEYRIWNLSPKKSEGQKSLTMSYKCNPLMLWVIEFLCLLPGIQRCYKRRMMETSSEWSYHTVSIRIQHGLPASVMFLFHGTRGRPFQVFQAVDIVCFLFSFRFVSWSLINVCKHFMPIRFGHDQHGFAELMMENWWCLMFFWEILTNLVWNLGNISYH